MNANKKQIAGDHYKKYGVFQVWDAWWEFKMDPFQANIIKYVMRTKGDLSKRLEDLDKAEHYLQKYKELLMLQLDNQEKQFNEANATSWNLTPTQAAIVKSVSYGDITAKLSVLEHVASDLRKFREQLIDQQRTERLMGKQ
jgi:hypothetical protein